MKFCLFLNATAITVSYTYCHTLPLTVALPSSCPVLDDAVSGAHSLTVRLSRDSPSFGRRTFFFFAYCPVGTTPFPKHGHGRSAQSRCFLDEGDFFARFVPDRTHGSRNRSPTWGLP